MGIARSVNKEPQSPYHRLCRAKIRKAKSTRYIDGQASDFYFRCLNGDINQVREILDAPDRQHINDLVKLEDNGDTALHAATRNGHVEIVQLLLKHRCSRIIINRSGERASQQATTPQMQKLFERPSTSDRFHESDANKTMTPYLPDSSETDVPEISGTDVSNEDSGNEVLSKEALTFVEKFKNEEEVHKYSLDYQTTAMWLKYFTKLSSTFPRLFRLEHLQLEAFNLQQSPDFKDFLEKKLDGRHEQVMEALNEAQKTNSIDPLLTIYSNEDSGFYKSLNRQLADSTFVAEDSPHLCDRFVMEFHIRANQALKRSFNGSHPVYRGATLKRSDLSIYRSALASKPPGVIMFRAFTSTSESKEIALKFVKQDKFEKDQVAVLFVIEVKVKSSTIIGISDVSDFREEEEILFMPGNLFIVTNIIDGKSILNDEEENVPLIEVYLEYLHVPISFWKKLRHTWRSATNSVTQDDDDNPPRATSTT